MRQVMVVLMVLAGCQTPSGQIPLRVAGDQVLAEAESALAREVVAEVIARYEQDLTVDDFVVHYVRGEPDTVFAVTIPDEALMAGRAYGGVRDPAGGVQVFVEPQHSCPPFC